MASGCTLLSISPILIQCSAPEYNVAIAQPLLLKYIWEPSIILEIGKLYTKSLPSSNNEETLVKSLLTKYNNDPYFEKEIIQDFSKERTLQLKGWILSETEAQQCALFYLLNKY